jgi:hypothetical protein
MTFLVRGLRKPFVDFSSGDYVIPNDISEDLSEGGFSSNVSNDISENLFGWLHSKKL